MEKPVLAIAKGSYGEAEGFNSGKPPKCAFVCLDGTRLPVRGRHGDGPDRCEKECVMAALGITESGRKEALGFRIGPSESAEGRGKCLESPKERGIGEPMMSIADGLQGMPEAIRRAFPGPSRQRRPVHVGRNVPSGARGKGRQAVSDDFKSVYPAGSEAEAKARLGPFVAKRPQAHPSFGKYLAEPGPFPFCRFPKAAWGPLCTSNAVEAFRACLKRKLRARLALLPSRTGATS